jgi:hypothetical protein
MQPIQGIITHADIRYSSLLVTVKTPTGNFQYIVDPTDLVGSNIQGSTHTKRTREWVTIQSLNNDPKNIPTLIGIDPTMDNILEQRIKDYGREKVS